VNHILLVGNVPPYVCLTHADLHIPIDFRLLEFFIRDWKSFFLIVSATFFGLAASFFSIISLNCVSLICHSQRISIPSFCFHRFDYQAIHPRDSPYLLCGHFLQPFLVFPHQSCIRRRVDLAESYIEILFRDRFNLDFVCPQGSLPLVDHIHQARVGSLGHVGKWLSGRPARSRGQNSLPCG